MIDLLLQIDIREYYLLITFILQVPYFTFDENLKAYFKKTEEFIAVDPRKIFMQ